MNEYTTFGFYGAAPPPPRPHGPLGSPVALFSSSRVQSAPPSVLLNNPLPLGASGPSPPERKVQPFLRKSHIPANSVPGCCGSIVSIEQPVEALAPASTLFQVLPPSLVLYTPRSLLSLQSLPGTQTYTVLGLEGSTRILTIRSDSGSPMLVQVSPPSVDL